MSEALRLFMHMHASMRVKKVCGKFIKFAENAIYYM